MIVFFFSLPLLQWIIFSTIVWFMNGVTWFFLFLELGGGLEALVHVWAVEYGLLMK